MLKAEVEKMAEFIHQPVHAERTESVWDEIRQSTSVANGIESDSVHGRRPHASPSDPSICPCGCGSVLKELFRYVLSEVSTRGGSTAAPTLLVEGRETPVCTRAKGTVQKFMASILHMDQIRKVNGQK